MALKYVASNTTYDFGKSEYTTTSNKYKRLNYIANGKTYQIGLATDSTATQYSPLKMKINDSTYYIGRSISGSLSSSKSTSNAYTVNDSNTYSTINGYRVGQSAYITTGYILVNIDATSSAWNIPGGFPDYETAAELDNYYGYGYDTFTTSIATTAFRTNYWDYVGNSTTRFGYQGDIITFVSIDYGTYHYDHKINYGTTTGDNGYPSHDMFTTKYTMTIDRINVVAARTTSTSMTTSTYNSAVTTVQTSYRTNTYTSSSSVSVSYSTSSNNFV